MKIIHNEQEYSRALEQIESLMNTDSANVNQDELEMLSAVIEHYEKEQFPIQMPDPIEAIKFRMEQEGLTQKDLIPYLGSQSRVSEILNGKRPLTLKMIRSLHTGLNIPYEVLMQDPNAEYKEQQYKFEAYPFNEMVHAGFFPEYDNVWKAKQVWEKLLDNLFSNIHMEQLQEMHCRRSNKGIDQFALLAWQARVIQLASQERLSDFSKNNISTVFFDELVNLTNYDKGILLVKEYLNRFGIHLVIVPHLKNTYLDGACFKAADGSPVIGMTLRHDRLDNFWFTLFHELAHMVCHLYANENMAFFDDMEYSEENRDVNEIEADNFSREIMINPDEWQKCFGADLRNVSKGDILLAADTLRVGVSIIAGRVRWETSDFKRFSELVGYEQVKKYLPYS